MSGEQNGNGTTRDRIVQTAMHLFATQGIESVTLRRISAESGSANTAAVHYHFGNKAGLVAAILAFLENTSGTRDWSGCRKPSTATRRCAS